MMGIVVRRLVMVNWRRSIGTMLPGHRTETGVDGAQIAVALSRGKVLGQRQVQHVAQLAGHRIGRGQHRRHLRHLQPALRHRRCHLRAIGPDGAREVGRSRRTVPSGVVAAAVVAAKSALRSTGCSWGIWPSRSSSVPRNTGSIGQPGGGRTTTPRPGWSGCSAWRAMSSWPGSARPGRGRRRRRYVAARSGRGTLGPHHRAVAHRQLDGMGGSTAAVGSSGTVGGRRGEHHVERAQVAQELETGSSTTAGARKSVRSGVMPGKQRSQRVLPLREQAGVVAAEAGAGTAGGIHRDVGPGEHLTPREHGRQVLHELLVLRGRTGGQPVEQLRGEADRGWDGSGCAARAAASLVRSVRARSSTVIGPVGLARRWAADRRHERDRHRDNDRHASSVRCTKLSSEATGSSCSVRSSNVTG